MRTSTRSPVLNFQLPGSCHTEVRCQRRCFNYSTGILCTNITACQAIYHGFPRGSPVIKDGNYIFITQVIAASLFIALSIFQGYFIRRHPSCLPFMPRAETYTHRIGKLKEQVFHYFPGFRHRRSISLFVCDWTTE